MADISNVTSSRERSHILLSNIFKQTFGELANLDKTSLNSWVVDRMTDIQRDIAVSMTLERDEALLNTCKKISTARDIGYNYGFNELNANPAKGEIIVLLKLPLDFRSQEFLIKADDNKFFVNDICYMLPGDILITSNASRYIQAIRRTNHVFDTTDNVILVSASEILQKEQVIEFAFLTEVIQLNYQDSYFIVSDHLELTNSVNEIEFEDNFYALEMWYDYYDDESTVMSKQHMMKVDDLGNSSSISEVYTVEIENENKLKITLGDGLNGKFYPGGKEIKYRIYTTKGSAGNVVNPTVVVGVADELAEVSFKATFNKNPVGGRNEYNLIELKDAIRKKIQTPGTIITEMDLKNSLSDILNLKTEETFYKLRRNDPVERILDLFIIVKDRSNSNVEVVVPTNSLDITINLDNIIDNEYDTIKPFFLIETSEIVEEGNVIRSNRMVPSYRTKIDNNMYYSSYYAIKLNRNPLMLNFFNLSANYNLVYEHTYTNTDYQEEVYINSAILERDIFSGSENYIFSLTLEATSQSFLEENNLIIRAMFTNTKGDKSYDKFYIDFAKTMDEEGNPQHTKYEAKITSLDIISNSNNLFVKNIYKLSQRFTDNTEAWAINTNDYDTEIVDSVSCEICIFYNYETGNVIENKSFKDIRDVRTKLLMSVYSIENINLYQDVAEIVYCQANYTDSKREEIVIKSVPLYKESYISDLNNRDVLLQQMSIEKSLKDKITERTEFPSKLSLKYFNTYGFSSLYSSLNNVSLRLEFEVSYRNNKAISLSEQIVIKNNLIKYIDTINKRSLSEDKNIYLSELVSIVRQNSSIVQCRIMNFSDNIYINKVLATGPEFMPTSLQLEAENIKFQTKSV